jgi:hypothetical protein
MIKGSRENRKESRTSLEDVFFAEVMQEMRGETGAGAEMVYEMPVLDDYHVCFFTQVSAGHRGWRVLQKSFADRRQACPLDTLLCKTL